MSSTSEREPPGDALSRMRTSGLILFAAGGLCVQGLTFALTIHLPRYFATNVGISLAAVGAAFTIVRLIDIAFDPLIGVAMDRTTTRVGRYRPWFVLGAPVIMLSAFMLFMAPAGASYLYLIVWLLAFYSGASVMGLAHAAWAGTLTNDYNQRARVFGFVQALALAGSVLAMLVALISTRFFPEADESGVHAMGWTMIALMPLLTLFAARSPEHLTPPPPRTKLSLVEYWKIIARPSVRRILLADLAFALGPLSLGPIFIFYWRDARGFTIPEANLMLVIFMVAGLFGAPFWAAVAQRLGKHRTIIISALAWIAFQAVTVSLPDRSPLCFVLMFCLGFSNAAMMTLIRALVADIADEVRLDYGKERSGFLYSLATSTQKLGGAISVAFTFWVLAWVGYVPTAGAANTAEHMRGLELLYALAPSGFQLVGLIAFLGFPLTAAKHAEIRAALTARDSEVRAASLAQAPLESSPQAGPLPRGV